MKRTTFLIVITLLIGFLFAVGTATKVSADGTETLGPPIGINIATGSGIEAAGTGLYTQPGMINLNIPTGITIKQVLLYWECQHVVTGGDDTIVVNGNNINGTLIGGPTTFLTSGISQTSSYRADITSLSLVNPGSNILYVDGLNCNGSNDGAGVLVIVDDGINTSEIQLRDGNDFAYHRFSSPLNTTVPQTFTFSPVGSDRVAQLLIFVSSIGQNRPNSIEISVNGNTNTYSNQLNSSDGEQWDTLIIPVSVPAGNSMLTVQLFSRDDLNTGDDPASLVWIGAGLSYPIPFEGCTPGYWKQPHHFDSWYSYIPTRTFSSVFYRTITINWSAKGKPNPLTDPTLIQALQAKGGGINALARAAVAALLNADNPDVSYAYTTTDIINMFQTAFDSGNYEATKDLFDAANNAGCPLN